MLDYIPFDNSTRAPQEGVSVHAGFPNAATDGGPIALNLHQLLIRRPVSTFLFRISGSEWSRYGVFDGDIAVIDRSLDSRPADLIIWWHADHGQFMLGRRQALPSDAAIWGCVTSIIHQTRKA